MLAFAIDQHQHLVGAEAAQGHRARHLGATDGGGLREVERRHESCQRRGELCGAGLLQLLRRDDVDGLPIAEDVDGEPIAEDLDGEPMEDVDGEPMDDIDGAPIAA